MADATPTNGREQNPRQTEEAWNGSAGGIERQRNSDRAGEGDRDRSVPTRASGRWSSTAQSRSTAYGSPFTLMRRMAEDLDRIFDQVGMGRSGWTTLPSAAGLGGSSLSSATWNPDVEVFRRGENVIVRADLPGLDKKDVKVDIENDVLTISGERSDNREDDGRDFYHSERTYGRFFRAIPLPDGTDPEKCEATFKDGVLEVKLQAPKPEAKKKTIDIK